MVPEHLSAPKMADYLYLTLKPSEFFKSRSLLKVGGEDWSQNLRQIRGHFKTPKKIK